MLLYANDISMASRYDNNSTIELNREESNYLKKKKVIAMCVDPSWIPFEKIDESTYTGINAEFIKLLQKKIGIPFRLVPTDNWRESLNYIKNKKCDILSLVSGYKNREKFINSTTPYITTPLAIALQKDKFFIPNITKLKGKDIAIDTKYTPIEYLKKKCPNINFVEVDNISDGLQLVAEDRVFGYIGNLTTIGYQIQNGFYTELKVGGRLDEKLTLGIGVRSDETTLLNILNRAIATIDSRTKEQISNRWIKVRYDGSYDIKHYWYILIPIILLALFLLIRQYILRRYNKRLKNEVSFKVEELRQKDELLLQKYRMAAMGEMLSMIAHQWRQPLGAISSAVMSIDIKLARGKFDLTTESGREEFLSYLEKKHSNINEYVNYLSGTTDDFRNFFNPNRDKESISLTKPIIDALHILQKFLETSDIEVLVDFDIEDEYMMYQNEIMQVIISILRNSQENFVFREIEDPEIDIKVYREDSNLVISICDNGGGVPKDIIGNIFEPYFSTKHEKNGSGLGLYMSKVMVEDHHDGKLTVENTEKGVCFNIRFKD
jgi:signal transduction histidine kinase